MSNAPSRSLRQVLRQLEFGTPEDPTNGYSSESQRIDFLTDLVAEAEVGGYDIDELKALFKVHGPKNFDIESWVAEQVAAGHYSESALIPRNREPEQLE